MILTIGSCVKDDKGNAYLLTDTLGEGGFGYVYKARREKDGMIFAVKTLQNDFPSNDMYLSFQKETNQSKLIESENVIKYIFIHDGKLFSELPPYIIMEYTADGTVRDLILNQKGTFFDNNTLVNLLLQLSKGMKAVNAQLVHRDIKPENILNFGGSLKITDFGLSKISGESTRTMTFKNGGTLLYIAPEAWNNDKNTIQMDIYSMGIVFYELATLDYPYSLPMKNDYIEYKNMHLFQGVKNPASVNNVLPPHIVSVIIKMLEKSTRSRFKSWDEIITAIESKPLPEDDISKYVDKAISLQNAEELRQQTEKAEHEKAAQERKDKISFAYSQYHNAVISPIREFVDRFNSKYPNGKQIMICEYHPEGLNHEFRTDIVMPSNKEIEIRGEIIFKENYSKEIELDPLFSRGRTKTVNYIPQFDKKDVILWCQVEDADRSGFNLLLLKNDDDIYGEWIVLENSTNFFSREPRISPFGFELSELPDEVDYLHTTHIYDMKPSAFSKEKMIDFISNHI